jgi:hypothetical protein
MEAAFGGPGTNGSDKRLRLEHAQILDLDDLKRAAEMGGKTGGEMIRRWRYEVADFEMVECSYCELSAYTCYIGCECQRATPDCARKMLTLYSSPTDVVC